MENKLSDVDQQLKSAMEKHLKVRSLDDQNQNQNKKEDLNLVNWDFVQKTMHDNFDNRLGKDHVDHVFNLYKDSMCNQ